MNVKYWICPICCTYSDFFSSFCNCGHYGVSAIVADDNGDKEITAESPQWPNLARAALQEKFDADIKRINELEEQADLEEQAELEEQWLGDQADKRRR